MMVVKSAPSFFAFASNWRRNPAMPPWRRSVRAATGRSGSADSSKYMSPAWLATAENRSGWRIASTSAPNPPDDLPPIARASRAATVRKRASIAGITSRTMCVS